MAEFAFIGSKPTQGDRESDGDGDQGGITAATGKLIEPLLDISLLKTVSTSNLPDALESTLLGTCTNDDDAEEDSKTNLPFIFSNEE